MKIIAVYPILFNSSSILVLLNQQKAFIAYSHIILCLVGYLGILIADDRILAL